LLVAELPVASLNCLRGEPDLARVTHCFLGGSAVNALLRGQVLLEGQAGCVAAFGAAAAANAALPALPAGLAARIAGRLRRVAKVTRAGTGG